MSKKAKIIISIVSVVVVLAIVIGSCNIYAAVVGSQEQIGVATGYAWNEQTSYDQQVTQRLDMGQEDYKVLVLTDVHLKNHGTFAAWLGINYLLDAAGKTALDKLVKNTDPDLILVLGDTVLTARNDIEMERFVKQMDSYGKPWAVVFGNHDDEGRADKAKLADVLLTSEYGLFQYGPQDMHGAGNYVIELTRNDKTQYAFFMLDSGSSHEFEAGTEGINDAQVSWYQWNMDASRQSTATSLPIWRFSTSRHLPIRRSPNSSKAIATKIPVRRNPRMRSWKPCLPIRERTFLSGTTTITTSSRATAV